MTIDLDVAVNLLWLAPGRVGGSEQYLTRQLAGLPADAGVRPRLMCQHAFPAAHPRLAERFQVELAPFRRDWRGARIIAEHTWLPARARGADVVHHGGGTAPVLGGRPILLTVHDVQYLAHPDYFSRARLAYLRWMMPRSVARAAVVATPSEFTRGAVIDAYGTDAERVVVVPHGVPEIERPGAGAIAAVRGRFGLGDRPYLVYPAITHPHKRHRVLLDMLPALDTDLALVLTGGAGHAEDELERAILDAGVSDRVVRTGRVSESDRDALVAGAELLVFPSEFEGFGAPLVEAMALGTPIVCSDHEAIREVVGEAAVIVPAGAPRAGGEAWALAVTDALSRRDELIAAGCARRASYTLEASGRALAAAYQRAARR